jgi:hypothetical protein
MESSKCPLNSLISITTFSAYFVHSWGGTLVWGFWNSTFFVFKNFDCEPRYASFSIFLYSQIDSLFLWLSLCPFFQNKAIAVLNPNLLKFLQYHNRFLRYLQNHVNFFNSAHYSLRAFLIFCSLLCSPCNKIWPRQDRNVLVFVPESWDPCLSSCTNCRLIR